MSLTDPFAIEIRDAIEDAPEWHPGMTGERMPCPHCEGSGYFVSDFGPAPEERTCEDCNGTGEFDEDDLGMVTNQFPEMTALLRADAEQAARWAAEERKAA